MPFITSQNPLLGTPTFFFFLMEFGLPATQFLYFFLFHLFTYLLWLSWVFIGECRLSSSRGYSFLTAGRFLTEVSSLVRPRLQPLGHCGVWAQRSWCRGLAALSVRDLPGPGIKPESSALAGRFSTTGPPGRSPGTSTLFSLEMSP